MKKNNYLALLSQWQEGKISNDELLVHFPAYDKNNRQCSELPEIIDLLCTKHKIKTYQPFVLSRILNVSHRSIENWRLSKEDKYQPWVIRGLEIISGYSSEEVPKEE